MEEKELSTKKPIWPMGIWLLSLILLMGCMPTTTAPQAIIPTEAPRVGTPTESADDLAQEPLTCKDDELLCVGLITDSGKIDDKSFNQSAWEGAQRAEKDLAAKIEFIESTGAGDYAQNIEYFVQQDFDVIVTVGFNLAAETISAAEKYPDVDFIGVDQNQNGVDPRPNLSGLIFSEKKAGFLAGALAGLVTESGTIGAVFGTDQAPPIVAFKEGYEMGAFAINPEIVVVSRYHPGGFATAFSDPGWGSETAQAMVDEGADVVFGAGGQTGNGALIQVAETDEVFCIGVDTDQWFTVTQARPCLLSSARKLISDGVFELIAWSLIGEFKQGNYIGDVDLAPYHEFEEQIPPEAQAFLLELKKGIDDGVIPLDGTYISSNPPLLNINR